MKVAQLYSIASARESIVRLFEERRLENPKFSIRKWSRQLGYSNPSTLSAVLRGARKLQSDLALRLIHSLTDDLEVADYIETLVHIENATNEKQREFYLKRLRQRHPHTQVQRLNNDAFWYIKEWQHAAILELAEAIVLPKDCSLIAKLLFGRVTTATINESIARLERLGLIKVKGGIIHRNVSRLEVFIDGHGAAIQSFHAEGLDLARQALEVLPPDQRNLQASLFSLSNEGYRKAVELINHCHEEVCRLAKKEKGHQVFSFATQLFPLSKDFSHKDKSLDFRRSHTTTLKEELQ